MFVLPTGPGQTCGLSDLRGRPVVLVFYPADWEPVSTDQLALYGAALPQIRAHGATLLAVSVDSVWCHRAFATELGVSFPLLSDAHPKGAVARAYGVYRRRDGVSERAVFVIDGEGIVRWRQRTPREVNPGVDGILTALERLAASPRVT